jgi:hypothetical protein
MGWNRYGYVYFNPLIYNDPDGHIALLTIAAIVGGVGLISGIVDAVIQHHNTGSVDLQQSATVALIGTGAATVVAGGLVATGVVTVATGTSAAATAATGTAIGTAVMADGDPTNEVTALQQGVNAATEFVDDTISLFRAVSQSEADDILVNNFIRPKPGGMEGKFFWRSLESAQKYLPTYSEYAHIVEIEVTQLAMNIAEQAGGFFENLDGFGDAVYFERGLIQMLNDNIINIILK